VVGAERTLIETPLEELPALTEALGGPRLLVKRDDKLPFGGSKFRKAVMLVEHALRAGADTVLTEGSVESQHARTLAIAARRRGLRCVLVLSAEASGSEPTLLDDAEGAELVLTEREGERGALVEATAARLIASGRRVEVVPFSGTNGLTTAAYVRAFEELLAQAALRHAKLDAIYLASATGGIHAGLELGKRRTGAPIEIVGVSPGLAVHELRARVCALIAGGSAILGCPIAASADSITVIDDYVGDGYLKPTAASKAAQRLLCETENLHLDPVYTAKAMAALIDHVRSGRLGPSQTVVFWHSAG
jgi:1-aminocyclopropane-1-carboxylate deaminase/D-cysteine desulfhydrase-like pyridoxal-dependent ACC family enzyme